MKGASRLVTSIAAVALIAAACSESGGSAAPDGSSVVVGDDGVETTVTDTSRIVSLSGDLTEIVFELGAGDRVVAVDITTTYPEAATGLPIIGFGQRLAVESVLAHSPTLVLANELTGPPEALTQLRGAGVPVLVLDTGTSFDDVERKIHRVAEALDLQDQGDALARRVHDEIADARRLAARATRTLRVAFIYTRGPQVMLLFGSGLGTHVMIEGAGAIDVGAELGVVGAVDLSPEALIGAAPDVIVVPEAGIIAFGGLDALVAIPGVIETPAGRAGAFLAYDEAYFFNLGPRVGRALMEFVLDLYPELDGSE